MHLRAPLKNARCDCAPALWPLPQRHEKWDRLTIASRQSHRTFLRRRRLPNIEGTASSTLPLSFALTEANRCSVKITKRAALQFAERGYGPRGECCQIRGPPA